MRIITCNVNGIRAAEKKGFFDWLKQQDADIICLQEVRADHTVLDKPAYQLPGMTHQHVCAEKKGYSGVSIYSKQSPKQVSVKMDCPVIDGEGRFIAFEFDNLTVASIYYPSGTSGDDRQAIKYDFMATMEAWYQKLAEQKVPAILCGDYNIAHTKKDIKNWRGNQKNSGFLPEERAWLDKLFGTMGFVDAFREVNQEDEQYTWWSNRGRAWENNTGWRIDYQVTTPALKGAVKQASIFKEARFSDHAPLIIDYAI